MTRILTIILTVAVGVLGVLLYSQTVVLREQRRQLRDLSARLESEPKITDLDLQEKCMKQAREEFKLEGLEGQKFAEFSNHYNPNLHKCFVETTNTRSFGDTIWNYKTVADAFEGKVYGAYSWHTEKNKKYWEVPPFTCEVTLLTGEKKTCTSSDEFDALVKQYME